MTGRARPAVTPIAVLGVGCRLPGDVHSAGDYWALLSHGRCAIGTVPAQRWALSGFYDPDGAPGHAVTRWGGFVPDLLEFDPAYFGISRREAEAMDPQQRVLLEIATDALLDAGLAVDRLAGSATGVYIGASVQDFGAVQRYRPTGADVHAGTGAALSLIANRISHRLDLRGPSLVVDTACSSALNAVHLACQALWRGECTLALAGGVNALLDPGVFVNFSRANMMSRSGRVHAFDARADGYVRGEGAGVVVLKPLDRALADGDPVRAVIRATASNQDGFTSTITVPSRDAQCALLTQVCGAARVAPRAVGYVEAHGTGTPVGDPIEAAAIGAVFGAARRGRERLWMGSGKTNIGHLESAAGIAGLIKAVLSLQHGAIAPSLNFETPNPAIAFTRLKLAVPTELVPWSGARRYAVVNSFGFGGSNAGALLESAPPAPPPVPAPAPSRRVVLTLSAATPGALAARALSLAERLELLDAPPLPALAASAALRTAHLPERLAVVAEDVPQTVAALRALSGGERHGALHTARAGQGGGPVAPVFVFSGQGSQWWGMARGLLEADPVFRATLDAFDAAFEACAGWRLLPELLKAQAQSRIDRTLYTQPGICAVQIALVERWRAWGVEPAAVIGHSVGEVAALYACGALDLAGAARVVHARASLQDSTEGAGAIVAVGLSAMAARQLLEQLQIAGVELAAVNAPELVNLAGDAAGVERIVAHLQAHRPEVFCRRIRMRFAAHSHHMDPLRQPLLVALAGLPVQAPRLPFISTVTGAPYQGVPDAEYWWRNVRAPVLFDAALHSALSLGHRLFLEVGPQAQLSGLVAQALAGAAPPGAVTPSLRREVDDLDTLHGALAALHVHGAAVDWAAVTGPARPAVPLPAYPWQRTTCWVESEERRAALLTPQPHPLLGRRLPGRLEQWQRELEPAAARYLTDHAIDGEPVFPAAGYLELMLAAGRELFGDQSVELEDVVFAEALFLAEGKPEFVLTAYTPERASITVHSRRRDGGGEWTLRAAATARARTLPLPAAPPAPPAQPPVALDADAFYALARRTGYDYGPAFQGMQGLVRQGHTLWAQATLPEGLSAEGYRLHPALLDACVQVALADLPGDEPRLHLPVAVRRVRYYTAAASAPAAGARALRAFVTNVTGADGLLRGSYVLSAPDGAVLATLEDVRFQPLHGGARRGESTAMTGVDTPLAWYREDFEPVAADPAPGASARRRWAIWPPEPGAALAAALREAGQELSDADAQGEAGPERLPESLDAVIYTAALDLPQGTVLADDALTQLIRGVLEPLRALALELAGRTRPPRLWVLTQGAAAMPGERAGGLLGAAVAGVVRTLRGERPELRATHVDLAGQAPADLAGLCAWLAADSPEADVALRAAAASVARLQRVDAGALPPRRMAGAQAGAFQMIQRSAGVVESIAALECEAPAPAPGEVVVEVHAAGLNFRDVMAATGLLPAQAEPTPAHLALGLECAGVVVGHGADGAGPPPGTPVLANVRGSLRRYVCVAPDALLAVPPGVDLLAAATLPTAYLTAFHALVTVARLEPGERVLIHTATGGVGLAAIQVARARGAQVLATAGSAEKRAWLRQHGIATVADSRSLDFADTILAATDGAGVDVVLNALPGPFIEKGLAVLAPYGRFLEIGKRDVYADTAFGLRALARNISLHVIDLAQIGMQRPALLRPAFAALAQGLADGSVTPLPAQVYPLRQTAQAVRDMAQARHIGKLVLDCRDPELEVLHDLTRALRLRADGAYLITGGLGGLGLALARMLAAAGAGHVVLLGRSAPSESAQAVLEALPASTQVHLVQGDVTQAADVRRAIAAAGVPLRGVFHGAMVLDDALLEQLDEARWLRVLAPKAGGALLLHELTRTQPLEHFVMFSSVSALFGAAGQANYVAANALLDALAHHRRAQDLPALTVNWGALTGGGVLARDAAMARYLDSVGLPALELDQACAALAVLLRLDVARVAVARVDFTRLARSSPALAAEPRLAGLLAPGGGGGNAQRELLRALQGTARERAVEDFLRAQVVQVLRAGAAQLDADRPLGEFGLDSLTAFELKNRIEGALDVTLPVGRFLQQPSLRTLTAAVLAELANSAAPDAVSEVPAGVPQVSPLSAMQRWMWQLYQAPRGTAQIALELAFGFAVRPALDHARLARALGELSQRHAQLRARFPLRDGQPTVELGADAPFSQHDATALDEAAFAAYLLDQAYAPYDLTVGPLFELRSYARPDGAQVLLMRAHHMVLDGSTALQVLNELLSGYLGLAEPNPVPTGSRYEDFVDWQHDWLQGPDAAAARAFWAAQVAQPPPAMALPFDFPDAAPNRDGAGMRIPLGKALSDTVLAQARAWDHSYFALLLAAFKRTLQGWGAGSDVVVNTTVAGRTQARFMETVGPFYTLMVLRTQLPRDLDLAGATAAVAHTVAQAMAHQDYPSSEYLPAASAAAPGTMLGQVAFAMRRADNFDQRTLGGLLLSEGGQGVRFGGYELRAVSLPTPAALRPLAVFVLEQSGVLELVVQYDAGRFRAQTVARLMQDYVDTLTRLLEHARVADTDVTRA